MTQEVVDRLLVRIKSIIFIPDPPVALFSGAIQDPQSDLEKHQIFKIVSKTEKIRKTTPKASKKNVKTGPRIIEERFLAKTWSLQYLTYENLALRALAGTGGTLRPGLLCPDIK
jgi:hypothetical protein